EPYGRFRGRTSVPSARAGRRLRVEHACLRLEEQFFANPSDDAVNSFAGFEICEHEGFRSPHHSGVAVHYGQISLDIRREVDLVDDEKVRTSYSGTTFARDLIPARNMDDVNRRAYKSRPQPDAKVSPP